MRRFFVTSEMILGQKVRIVGELVHYLGHVLRLQPGVQVELLVGEGQIHLVELQEFDSEFILGQVLSVEALSCETRAEVTLFQGMPKGDKLEWIIQKCTELGVSRIVPVFTDRSVVKLDDGKSQKKVQRWQKIADQASQQAQRVTLPEIVAPMGWKQALSEMGASGLTLVMWESEETQGLKEVLSEMKNLEKVNLVIGPEGGLTVKEIEDLKEQGAYSVTLGKRILRTETAGMAALAMLLYHTGDLG